jgi:hypothetical protein
MMMILSSTTTNLGVPQKMARFGMCMRGCGFKSKKGIPCKQKGVWSNAIGHAFKSCPLVVQVWCDVVPLTSPTSNVGPVCPSTRTNRDHYVGTKARQTEPDG